MNDLWPDDIEVKAYSPAGILKEQALLLGRKKWGLRGEIIRQECGDLFVYDFFIVAPSLDDFKYKVLEVVYGIEMYPLDINDLLAHNTIKVDSEEQFVKKLKEIFNSEGIKRVLGLLASQALAEEKAIIDVGPESITWPG